MRKTNTVQTNDSVAKRFFKSILSSDKLGLLIALAMIVAVFQVLTKGTYLTVGNIRNIMISSAIVGMAMIGETFLMITGGIDLSPGSVAAFSGVLVAMLLTWGVPLPLAVLLTVIVGAIGGYLNSLLINKLRFIPFIATLAAMSVFRGAASLSVTAKLCSSIIRRSWPSVPNGCWVFPYRLSFSSCSSFCSGLFFPEPGSAETFTWWAATKMPPVWQVSTQPGCAPHCTSSALLWQPWALSHGGSYELRSALRL